MRARILIPVVIVALAVLAGGALFAYGHAQAGTIAKGVKVGGVGVGGLSRAEAQAKLRRDLVASLRRKIVVHHGTHTFTLTVRRADVQVNVDASVNAALARSQTTSFGHAIRALTGSTVNADIQPQVTYSHKAVVHLLNRVRKAINRHATNARIEINADGIKKIPARVGLKLQTHRLHTLLLAAVTDPDVRPKLVATTLRTEPKVRTTAAAKKFATTLIVNRSKFTLSLYKDFKLVKRYDVSIGVQGLETPAGLYHIQNKEVNPGWQVPNSPWAGSLAGTFVPPGPADPIKARWLGIIDGAGIHGVDPSEYGSIGHAGSHGCVRMRIPDVIDLYPRVPVGAPIYIA